jgi:hypothetical protein
VAVSAGQVFSLGYIVITSGWAMEMTRDEIQRSKLFTTGNVLTVVGEAIISADHSQTESVHLNHTKSALVAHELCNHAR